MDNAERHSSFFILHTANAGERNLMRYRLSGIAFLALLASALPAAAQEHEAVALSPFAGDLGNAIWTLVIFVIVVVLLGKFAWGPVLGLLKQREEFIRTSLSDAKRDRDEAEAKLKEYAAKLQSAQAEAMKIIEETRRDAERLREELRARAKAEADTLVANAGRQIQLETTRALQQIRNEAVDLSVAIASKLLQRNISKADNEKLIDEALRQIDTTRSH
jgi:F-type H+-transporting ATPase subunit b